MIIMKNASTSNDGGDDLMRPIRIRGTPLSVHFAIMRQLDHYGYHVGPIATIARMQVGTSAWSWFTLAPGDSPPAPDSSSS